jgi:hypothetical protein
MTTHGADEPIEIVAGGLYSSRQEDGTFRVVKVLVVDQATVHLRMYAERFIEIPDNLHSTSLSLGSVLSEAFGIGHYPIARGGFFQNEKRLLAKELVADEELDGYRIWAEGCDDA